MPTPRDNSTQLHFAADPHVERSMHTTCPVEDERGGRRGIDDARPDPDDIIDETRSHPLDAQPTEKDTDDPLDSINDLTKTKTVMMEQEHITTETSSPMSATSEPKEAEQQTSSISMSSGIGSYSSIDYGIPNVRVCEVQIMISGQTT